VDQTVEYLKEQIETVVTLAMEKTRTMEGKLVETQQQLADSQRQISELESRLAVAD